LVPSSSTRAVLALDSSRPKCNVDQLRDHDALFSRAQREAFLAALPAARLKVYEETGHCPNWERPEWVAADVADFVARAVGG
jgi:hypothetical protein